MYVLRMIFRTREHRNSSLDGKASFIADSNWMSTLRHFAMNNERIQTHTDTYTPTHTHTHKHTHSHTQTHTHVIFISASFAIYSAAE